ncbi:MAG: hypothetical protein E8D45_04335 [Nitrospira sp.]|nr:MAG: hypothetical protein E8D45_04335 [Nitrospira sp.]
MNVSRRRAISPRAGSRGLAVGRNLSIRRFDECQESVLQRAFKEARLKAGISKPASGHTLRHSFADTKGNILDGSESAR